MSFSPCPLTSSPSSLSVSPLPSLFPPALSLSQPILSPFHPPSPYLPIPALSSLFLSTYARSLYFRSSLSAPTYSSLFSPPLFLSTYTRSLLALSLPSPAYSIFSFYPYTFYLPIPTSSTFPLPLPSPAYSLSPPPSDERDEGYPTLLMREERGAGDSHIPLTPRGKSEGRDRNKIPEATYPLWGTSPRVYL